MVNALKFALAVVAVSVSSDVAQGREQISVCPSDDGAGNCDVYGTPLYTSVASSQMNMQCVEEGMFALTFHGGPDASTEKLLPLLRNAGIRATFFISGHMLGDESSLQVLKQIEDDGHAIAMNGDTTYAIGDSSYPGGTSPQNIFDKEITAMKARVTPLKYGFFGAFTPKYQSITFEDVYGNSAMVDLLGYNGIRTVWPTLNYESEPSDGGMTNAEHIEALYTDIDYRQEQDERFDGMMDYLIDNNQPHSFIASMAASQPGAEEWLDRVIQSLALRDYYTVVDIRTCLGIPLEKGAYDMRAQACMAKPCADVNACRNSKRECGAGSGFCYNTDTMWKPECTEDISLGEAVEVLPPKQACSGEMCPTTTECRGQDDMCSVDACDVNMDPTWTLECPVPEFPLETCGMACDVPTQCRRALDSECGTGWDYCSATSLWTPSCVEDKVDESTPKPTMSPTETDVGGDGDGADWLCTGAPCDSESECRSQATFKCGTSPEYCNAKSVWTDLCTTKNTGGAAQVTLSLSTLSVSVLALVAGLVM